MIRVHGSEYDIEASRNVERATQALVPACSPGALPTDPKHLNAMFVFCKNNWRTYSGDKPTGDKLARINAVHKQATIGDCTDAEWSTPFEKTVLKMWRSYKGTAELTAKRRFLTLIRDVDPRLLQIKAYQFLPWGFPTTAEGGRICPYSNAKKGCPRPLMDKYGHNLEQELETNESLAEFVNLKAWLDEVAAQQRCALGLHTAISAEMGRKFSTFFARPECGGFQPYTSTKIHSMVKKVLTKQLMVLVEMQNNPRNFSRIAQSVQRDRVLGLQQYYTILTGQEFSNEVSCSRDSHHCNTRRLAEGSNHTHPIVIRTPPTDLSLYDSLIQVRRECVRLGAMPITGPVHSIDHRCSLLQMKVVDFHRKQMLVYESQRRQQWRIDIAPHDAAMLKTFSHNHRSDCLRLAMEANDMDRICLVVESGGDPSTELPSGLFPLMAAVLDRSIPHMKRLRAAGADIDYANSKGMTALMWAVKRDDYAMVDSLLEEKADVQVEGCTGWTAMGIASRHGRADVARLLIDALRMDKISGEMNASRVLNHRSAVNGGLTPVAIAAIHRNEAMARFLMRLGAKPGVRCHQGYVAGEHAAKAGWAVFGLWLQETQAFGGNGVYTFADMNAESALRVAAVRMLDAISSGATVEDSMKKGSRPSSAANKSRSRSSAARSRPASPLISNGTEIEASSNVPASRDSTAVSTDQAPEQVPELETGATLEVKIKPHPGLLDVTKSQLEQVRSNTLLTVSILQEGRAAPDAETDNGDTALISAAYRGRLNDVRSLIQEGADPDYPNRNGRTALMAAAAVGDRKVVLMLLRHKADAAWTDIHGKVAGAYAFEKGFKELAELLAIAASDGHQAALDWEIGQARRIEEERERQQTEKLLDKAGEDDIPEANLNDWMIRVTKPREAARIAARKQADLQSSKGGQLDLEESKGCGNESVSPAPGQQHYRRRQRCPKCTLFLPCLHFHGTELPDGVDEWSSSNRSASRRIKQGGRRGVVNTRSGNKTSAPWWRALHQAHRDRSRTPRPADKTRGVPELKTKVEE